MDRGYYAIIPANVRYDKDLTANAKLLYAEITALANEKGYCWATNGYFAELYGVSNRSIINWINNLEKQGYICTKNIYEEGTKNIKCRYIYLNNNPQTNGNNFHGVVKKSSEPSEKNFTGVVKKSSEPSEKNFTVNNKYNNTVNNKYNNPPISPRGENGGEVSKNKSKNKKVDDVLKEFDFLESDNEMIDALKEFEKMRKLVKKPLTARAMKLNINALMRLSQDRDERLAIINQSIQNSWQGFYELKNKQFNKTPYKQKNEDDDLPHCGIWL
ncbi:hypothetical protein ABID14_000379 [Peptoniphilus olsenii]|uniref:Helix-turn-helix domain-containing protein n=1 Tax=Peptoniphilus olsenii TaxID=411570 RepID=A0ABV2JAG5_9FIRM